MGNRGARASSEGPGGGMQSPLSCLLSPFATPWLSSPYRRIFSAWAGFGVADVEVFHSYGMSTWFWHFPLERYEKDPQKKKKKAKKEKSSWLWYRHFPALPWMPSQAAMGHSGAGLRSPRPPWGPKGVAAELPLSVLAAVPTQEQRLQGARRVLQPRVLLCFSPPLLPPPRMSAAGFPMRLLGRAANL